MNCLTLLFPYILSIFLLSGAYSSPAVIPLERDENYRVFNDQDLYPILASVEERLTNIDQILIRLSDYTARNEFTHIQRRLDSLENKITRLESTVGEFFKNTKDNNEILKSVIKSELNVFLENKVNEQGAAENIISKLEKIEDELTSRDEETQAELSDIIGLMEDLKSPCYEKGNVFSNEVSENSAYPQTDMNDTGRMKNQYLDHFEEMNTFANWSTDFLMSLRINLQQDLNDYANKVADMNSGFWEANEIIRKNLQTIEKNINLTKSDLHNLFKKFMIQLNRRFHRNSSNDFPSENYLDEMTQHINSNFEKILSTQNLFLESCYKLQNDDSQIESRIENLLQMITEELETKSIIGLEEIRKITTIMTNHDATIKQYLKQDNENYRTPARENSDDKYHAESSTMDLVPEFWQYANYTEIYVEKSVSGQSDVRSRYKSFQKKYAGKRLDQKATSNKKPEQFLQKPTSGIMNTLQNFKKKKIYQKLVPNNMTADDYLHNFYEKKIYQMLVPKNMTAENYTGTKGEALSGKAINKSNKLHHLENNRLDTKDLEKSNYKPQILDNLGNYSQENYENNNLNTEINSSSEWYQEPLISKQDNVESDQNENSEGDRNIFEYLTGNGSNSPEKQNEDNNVIISLDSNTTDDIFSTTPEYSEDPKLKGTK